MTREQQIEEWLPQIDRFLRATCRDWNAGLPIRKKCTPNELQEEIPWVVRRHIAEQYNLLIWAIIDGEAKSANKFEVKKTKDVDAAYMGLKSASDLERLAMSKSN